MAGTAPAAPSIVRRRGHQVPDRLLVRCDGLDRRDARVLAERALRAARLNTPKLSGRAARGMGTVYGDGFFGITWKQDYLWWQEAGRRPQTMRALAGKVIPMWVEDPTGKMARENPKAKRRTTANGRRQVLIFRRAAKIGQRKRVRSVSATGVVTVRDVPASYPGAPGRIVRRQWNNMPPPGRTTGRIATSIERPHVGVRWRHPGLLPRDFMTFALLTVAREAGWSATTEVHASYGGG